MQKSSFIGRCLAKWMSVIILLVVLGLVIAARLAFTASPSPGPVLGPMLGAISDHGVKVWVRTGQDMTAAVTYRLTSGGAERRVELGDLTGLTDWTAVAVIDGLTADSEYEYRVLFDDAEVHRGAFKTLPTAGTASKITFAYGADLHVVFRPFRIFEHVAKWQPDFMILGGDNIYVDTPEPVVVNTREGYLQRYRETFSDRKFRPFAQRVPLFMMWDDHELSNDWYQGKNTRYGSARAAYELYQHSHNPDPLIPGEIFYTFEAGGADFFVLDTRSHRTPNDARDGASKTMLGFHQRDALIGWLEASEAPFKFIVSSVPFNDWATTRDDAWNGVNGECKRPASGSFRDERQKIFEAITSAGVEGVFLLSGDQHWAGVFKLDIGGEYPLYEFMPTPLAINNRTAPTCVNDSPQIIFKEDERRYFGLFQVDTTVEPASLNFKLINHLGATRCDLTITRDQVGVEAKSAPPIDFSGCVGR